MQLQSCPTRETLQNYLNGRLEEELAKAMDDHLEECEVCEQTATNLECEPDTMVEILGKPAPSDAPSLSDDLCDALQRLHAIADIDPSVETRSEVITKIGGYSILSRLGRGGMGNVYLAQHRQLGKQVALKVLPALLARNSDALARFQREMRAVGKLDHPTIVRATDAGESDGHHFLVMERVEGLDVSQVARHCGSLSPADAAEIIRQAALGLSYAHAQGIVHRDIKPSNLMLSSDGNLKILDFGLAQISLWEEGAAEITTVGQLMGTLDYMAPEQAERQGAVDYRADLYSLGATLFRLLTGRAPLAASPHLTPLEKLRLLNDFSPPKIQTLRSDLPEAMCKIVGELLEHEPSKRPASAAHVAERLASLAQGANLRALLHQARTKIEQADDSDSEPPQIAIESGSSQRSAEPQSQSKSGRIGRVIVALAACLLPIGILAGFMVVVEMQKGQLVIQSENANVKVRIVSDQEQSQSVQITPGAQSTKLKAGKYEIELESPSDSFSLDKNQFNIKNGETVVATISERPASEPETSTPDSSQVLTEAVYGGKNLDAWLRILQYEAGDSQRSDANFAIQKIANRQNEAQIRERVLQILQSNPNEETFSLLPGVAKDQFFVLLTELLEKADDQSRMTFLNWTALSHAIISRDSFDHIDPFLAWMDSKARGSFNNEKIVDASASFFHDAIFDSDASPAAQAKIIEHLNRWGQFSDDNFWFVDISKLKEITWSDPLCEAVIHRIESIVADEKSSDVLLAKATATAHFIAGKNRALVENAIKANPAFIKSRLSIATKNIDDAIKIVRFEDSQGAINQYANPLLELVKVLRITGQGDMFKDELRALHDAVPLGQVKETLAYLTKENRFKSVKELDIEYMKLKSGNVIFIDVINADKIFTISGELIGIPSDELKSKLYQPFVPGDAIRAGDTLAIHIPGLTPLGKPAQEVFLQAGNQPPVPGLPFQVASDGSVVVPQIGKVVVVDQTLDQTRDALISRLDGLVTESQKKSVQVHTLMYANQTLEVRRIFGPETGRDGGNAESDESASTNTSSSSSALLKESVYQGQDLESWLNVLEYETYSGKREEAADAITRMINLKNRELVAERTASILEKNASYLAVKVLAEATGDQFFYKLTPILEKSEPKALTSILGGLSSTRIEIQSLKQIEPFLKWASSVIPKEASDSSVLEEAKNVFKAMIFYGNSRPAAQAAIIEQVDQWPNFTNENFWIDDLIKIETAWTPKLREVEARRIKEILQDKNSDKKLVAKALSMALFISNQDKDLIATMFRESPETVSNWLMPSPNFEEALQAREVDRTWGDVNRNENARLYPTLMLLDLLSVTGMGHEFRSELEKFHAAVPRKEVTDFLATSLAERRTSDRTVLIDNFNRFNPHDGPRVRLKNIETMHNKSGELLGISKEQLDSEIFPPMDVAKQIRPGDVLAINIPGLTPIPQSSKIYPPTVVLQAGKAAPVPGMPFIVDPSGNISLPSIGTISVEGKLVAEVVETIQSNPKYQEMYGSDGENSVDVNILMMVGRYQEVRQIMGPAVDLGESNAKANR